MSDLDALEGWAAPLIAALSPAARRTLLRALAVDLRRSQQERIARQQNPDGSAYVARRPQRAGHARRAMFHRIRQARYLKAKIMPNGVQVGYQGRVARIARVHQEGGAEQSRPSGAVVRYARRKLLGLNEMDRDKVRRALLSRLIP
ncbi:phage virion morphogenesis protein [Lysobacter capsici]|uniref:phage virion morphogenesis protein n=1 Tax=Lysobacter capsici TaxID=435897 RepID=UPI00177A9F93|nr:phage virion morphogenesis protein [Lysobacter capsici]UOF13249.1 phage virion morphogenesis protein [Lysobacter capsici]